MEPLYTFHLKSIYIYGPAGDDNIYICQKILFSTVRKLLLPLCESEQFVCNLRGMAILFA